MSPASAQLEASTTALKRGWNFLESFDVPTGSVKDRSAVFVRKTPLNGKPTEVYVKIYANKRHPFQRLFRQGRSQNEVKNLLFFRSVGIATPEIVAWGERRNPIGRIVEEFIITASKKGTLQLDAFIDQYCDNTEREDLRLAREQIARRMGEWTAAMHAGNFIHEDLNWRNVLARMGDEGPELFWIDCPNGRFMKPGSGFERKKLKDCAALDKVARLKCSIAERRAFVEAYLGGSPSDEQVKALCDKIENFRRTRFDPKDDKQLENA